MNGYLYLLVALIGGLVKGFSGKKISRDVKDLGDSVFVNLIRMILCALIGAALLSIQLGASAFRIGVVEFAICFISAVAMCVFCVCWMCAYRNEAYMFLSVFTMLASIVTCICGFLIYKEPIGILQWCGMGILLSAVFVMSKYNKDIKKGKRFSKNEIIILVLGCIGASVADFCQKIFVTETGNGAAVLNFYSYAIGGVLLGATLILISAAKHNIKVSSSLMSRGNLLGYVGISAFLYVNSIFKTMAVGTGLSTAQIYPVLNGANLIASAILANILFKEKITLKSVAGMALAFIGVILINLF